MKEPIKMKNIVSMTSIEIVKLTNKAHKNVLRDCKKLSETNGLKNELVEFSYNDAKGEKRKAYRLTKKATFVLVSGYSAELRIKCFEYIESLESKVMQLNDQLALTALLSANRCGVTWGDYCRANDLPAQKLIAILKQQRKLFRVNSDSGKWEVMPKYEKYFRVIKPTDWRFNPSGINIRFNADGLKFFSKPENIQTFRNKLTVPS